MTSWALCLQLIPGEVGISSITTGLIPMEQCEGVAHARHGHLVATAQTPANIIAGSEEMRDGLPVLIAHLELTVAAHAGRCAEEETRRLGRTERWLEHRVHELGILAPILVDTLLA